MPISYTQIEEKIKARDYESINRATFAISRTTLSKPEKKTLTELAQTTYSSASEKLTLQEPINVNESILSKVDGGRSLSAKANPERIMAFDDRLTHLAFHFLSVAVDFKLSKEELGRKLAAKLKTL